MLLNKITKTEQKKDGNTKRRNDLKMNNKGQGAVDYFFTYGWAMIIIAIVVGVLVFIVAEPSEPDTSSPAFKFCKAWAEERGFNPIDGKYGLYKSFDGKHVKCTYSALPEVFDGGTTVQGEKYSTYFSISKYELEKWGCDCNCGSSCKGEAK